MPNWGDIQNEIHHQILQHQSMAQQSHDMVRMRYLEQLQKHTGRNVIAYYSGWLSKPQIVGLEINDEDKNGFMMAVHKLDRDRGLDLILHTPGGDIASTQSIVDYLRKMFGNNIRAVVPQIAMSAGTIIACSCKEILMGKQSNLGPIDPQVRGVPAYGVIREFKRAVKEIKKRSRKRSGLADNHWQVPPHLSGAMLERHSVVERFRPRATRKGNVRWRYQFQPQSG